MIQDLDYTKRKKRYLPTKTISDTGLNLIRVADDNFNFNTATGNGEEDHEEPKLTEGQQSYLDSLEKTKTTARERAGFLFDKPDKPEMDEEQRKRFKNLTKAGAIAQLVDAVSDVALGARNQDYRPVATSGDELAFSGLEQVYNMDQDFRNQMRGYEDQVFTIDQKNKQTEAQLNQQNENVDVDKAQSRMRFELDNRKIQALKDKAKYDEKDEKQKRYFDSGLRLISQGEEEAALVMLEKAGLDIKDAKELLGKDSGGNDSTTITRLNRFMGYDGKKNSVTNLQMQMLKDYKGLRNEIDKEGYDVHFNEMTGDPRTGKGRDLLQMEKELGALRFVPDDMLIEDVNKSASGTVGSGEGNDGKGVDRTAIGKENEELIQQLVTGEGMTPEEVAPIAQKLYENGARLGLSKEEVDDQLDEILDPESEYNQSQSDQIEIPGATEPAQDVRFDSEGGRKELTRYSSEAREAFMNAEDPETKRTIMTKLGRVLERSGMTDEQIQQVLQGLLSAQGSSNPGGEVTTVEEPDPADPGFIGRDVKRLGSNIDRFLKSTPTENIKRLTGND